MGPPDISGIPVRRGVPVAGWKCPNCGTSVTEGDKHCRTCGVGLSFEEDGSRAKSDSPRAYAVGRWLGKPRNRAFAVAVVVILIALIGAVLRSGSAPEPTTPWEAADKVMAAMRDGDYDTVSRWANVNGVEGYDAATLKADVEAKGFTEIADGWLNRDSEKSYSYTDDTRPDVAGLYAPVLSKWLVLQLKKQGGRWIVESVTSAQTAGAASVAAQVGLGSSE
jgi:hypothetical protein